MPWEHKHVVQCLERPVSAQVTHAAEAHERKHARLVAFRGGQREVGNDMLEHLAGQDRQVGGAPRLHLHDPSCAPPAS